MTKPDSKDPTQDSIEENIKANNPQPNKIAPEPAITNDDADKENQGKKSSNFFLNFLRGAIDSVKDGKFAKNVKRSLNDASNRMAEFTKKLWNKGHHLLSILAGLFTALLTAFTVFAVTIIDTLGSNKKEDNTKSQNQEVEDSKNIDKEKGEKLSKDAASKNNNTPEKAEMSSNIDLSQSKTTNLNQSKIGSSFFTR